MAPGPAATILAMLLMAVIPSKGALAQPPAGKHEIPVSLQLAHQESLAQLTALTRHRGRVGEVAAKALELFKRHSAREEEYIFPPLTLAPVLAGGRVTPDMKWAVAMADRIKAEGDQIYDEHARMTQVLSELLVAAEGQHDTEAADTARSMVVDSFMDLELMGPMAITIGEYIRTKLASEH